MGAEPHRYRPHAARLLLAVGSTALALLVCEGVLRVLGDYRLDRLELTYTARHTARGAPWYEVGRFDLGDFADRWTFAEGVDPAWLFEELPAPASRPHRLDFIEREVRHGYGVNQVYNRRMLASERFQPEAEARYPFLRSVDEVLVFESEPGSPLAVPYRLPARATLPPAFNTNSYGWRGPEVPLDKPDDTVRIVCLGASTTLNRAATVSYPELLQAWLNRWAQREGIAARFEVINAGRDGIGADAIAAIAETEVMPLEPDYLVYYEGANDLQPSSVVTFDDPIEGPAPPEQLPPEASRLRQAWRTVGDHWATARRLSTVLDRAASTPEPPKPAQTFRVEPAAWVDGCGPDDAWPVAPEVPRHLDHLQSLAVEGEASLVALTFVWLAHADLRLDATRHAAIHAHLNERLWPCSYDTVRRAADLQNRALGCWADERGVDVIDVAAQMPAEPDLFYDAVHNNDDGVRIRAWIALEGLLPVLRRDLAAGRIPRPDRGGLDAHPRMGPDLVWKKVPGELDLAQLAGEFVGEPL